MSQISYLVEKKKYHSIIFLKTLELREIYQRNASVFVYKDIKPYNTFWFYFLYLFTLYQNIWNYIL